jgi:multiple sugar transport system permease protein
MLTPAVVLLLLVLGVPILRGIGMSFEHIVLTKPSEYRSFVGFENYITMVQSDSFWHSVGISLYYTFGVVVGCFGIGLALALLVNRSFFARPLARAAMIVPWAVPWVSATLVWGVMYDQQFGVINSFLNNIPFFSDMTQRINWLGDELTVMPSLILVNIWNEFPIAFLMILAGLQSIDRTLYEAAKVDGANAFQTFRFITMPSMKNVNAVVILILCIWAFRRFTVIYILTQGGPGGSSEALIIQTYQEAFRFYNFSYAATLGVASLIFSLLFTVIYLYATKMQKAGT